MAIDVSALAALCAPAHTAVVTSEVQNGVVGEPSSLPELAAAAQATMIPAVSRLVQGARKADANVVHCLFQSRPDGRGGNANAPLFRYAKRAPVHQIAGTPAVEVIPEVGAEPSDIVLTRSHGLNPMSGTDLDSVLRNLGVTTVIAAGVSVNVAVTNMVMEAVNHGYEVVVPRDAVCGVPAEYADAVIDNTLRVLATVTTVDEVVAAWSVDLRRG
jgi:nicotinamidase-related amidase